MMFGMFEFTAADGVSPKPSTERTRMTALVSSFPKGSAFLIEVPFGKEPTLGVFHLPRSGGGASLYWTTVGPLIGPAPVQDLKWNGNAFEFQTVAARQARRRVLHRHRDGRRRRHDQGHDAAQRTDAAAVVRLHRDGRAISHAGNGPDDRGPHHHLRRR